MVKFTRKTKEIPEKAAPLHAYVMLSASEYDFEAFINRFEGNWYFDTDPYWEENSLSFIVQGMAVNCVFHDQPISEPEVVQDAQNNFLWPGAETHVTAHVSHISVLLTAIKDRDVISTHRLFSQVVSSLLDTESTCGVYLQPGVVEKSYYIKTAEALARHQLATELWVHVNAVVEPESISFSTHGMDKFDKNEFEILHTKKNFIESYYYLKQIIAYTITNDIAFTDGDTIGPDQYSENPIEVSSGVLIEGVSVKIEC